MNQSATLTLPFHKDHLRTETSTDSDQMEGSYSETRYFLDEYAELPKSNSYAYCSKAKKSLCRNFMERGCCPYGYKCQFAHGTNELVINSNENRTYKTRPCFAFSQKGHCSYGQRCNFIHHKLNQEMQADEKWRSIYSNFRDLFTQINQQNGSRLLKLVQK